MTDARVLDIPRRIAYTASGLNAEFDFPFLVLDATSLAVYLDNERQTSGYSVSGAGVETGGTVTFTTPPPSGTAVLLAGDQRIERTTVFQPAATLRAEALNTEFDRLTIAAQELQGQLDRSLRRPVTAAAGNDELPAPVPRRALMYLAANAGGGVDLGLSSYDPDDGASLAASAVSAAAAAQATATAAAAAAATALSATNNFGEVPRGGELTLVEAQSTYDTLLAADDTVGDVRHFTVEYGGASLRPTVDFTLSANGRGIVLAGTVIAAGSIPAAGELVAGETVWWACTPGLTSLDIGIGAVGATNLADDAVVLSGAKVAAVTADRLLVSDASGKVAVRAFPAEGKALGGGVGGTSLTDLTLPAAAADGDVSGRTGTGYVTAGQLGLADLVAATILYNSAAPAVIYATSGFTLSRPATGQIKVTFATAFASADAYVGLLQNGGASHLRAKISEQLAESITFDLRNSNGDPENTARCHILIVGVK
jgi:hypothetical protein